MRKALDVLYALSLALAALALVAIAVLVGAQVVGRIADNTLVLFGYRRYGFIILSLSEICGFLLAAATFLALGGSLKAGSHIRVTLILQFFPEGLRRGFELFALGFSTVASVYMTWFLGRMTFDSWRFNELSIGLIPIQLYIPQIAMVVGSAILTIAILDEFLTVIAKGRPSFRAAEDAIALGKEG